MWKGEEGQTVEQGGFSITQCQDELKLISWISSSRGLIRRDVCLGLACYSFWFLLYSLQREAPWLYLWIVVFLPLYSVYSIHLVGFGVTESIDSLVYLTGF